MIIQLFLSPRQEVEASEHGNILKSVMYLVFTLPDDMQDMK